ncbi:MAG: sigma-70 family RNA polymerase sigma factor [Acidimicrobiales bacterium]|jgi:RNA polymerase sigma-70 factor (ECF subfamily)
MEETDEQILSWSTIGDSSAFIELTWRHGAAIHRYLSRRAGRAQADDLLGEVWVQAFRSRATYDHAWPDARPWLYGIARNVLRAHWRATARPAPRIPTAVSDPWPSVDEQLDAKARRPELKRALEGLTDDEREVLLLVTWEQLSQAEIAFVLGVPAGTVRSRLHRARTAMRGQLGAEGLLAKDKLLKES